MTKSPNTVAAYSRIRSIDAFRGLTMLLMVFVNDFWTLEGVPKWLLHAKAGEDYLGFSDIIFPVFLFIVGLSIPFAIDHRRQRGESTGQITMHILTRALALLVMGVFIVNRENIADAAMVINRYWWQILMVVGFMLIWNNYRPWSLQPRQVRLMQALGLALLIFLAVLFRGGDAADPVGMRTYWWGILGLIGWAYLYAALLYLLVRGKWLGVLLGWLAFVGFHLLDQSGYLAWADPIRSYVWISSSGGLTAFTVAGVMASVLLKHNADQKQYPLWLLGLALIAFAYGWLTRPAWGIAKLGATPAWVGICTGISLVAFALLYWLIDMRQQDRWTWIIGPAGRSTLTCYLVPYLYYAVITLLGLTLPLWLRTGGIGLIKSLVFAFVIVGITGILNRFRISLRI